MGGTIFFLLYVLPWGIDFAPATVDPSAGRQASERKESERDEREREPSFAAGVGSHVAARARRRTWRAVREPRRGARVGVGGSGKEGAGIGGRR